MGGGIEDANREYYCSLTKQLMITRDACRYYATHLRAQQHRFEETEFYVLINNRKGMLKEDKKRIPPLLDIALNKRAQEMERKERFEKNKRRLAASGIIITSLNGPKGGALTRNKRAWKREKINFRRNELFGELISRDPVEREKYVKNFYDGLHSK